MKNTGILISSAGRRVGLLQCMRESIARHAWDRQIVTADSGFSAPATYCSDTTAVVPNCLDPGFIPAVLEICRTHRIELVIPTIDTELPVYATARDEFARRGITVSISSPEAVEICFSKAATHRWLTHNGFPTPRQTDVATALAHPVHWPFPLIAKPLRGSASIGVKEVRSRLELKALLPASDQYVLEEMAFGREFTVNVYVNRLGECVCAIPHWRMEVRAGEVSKGITVRDPQLIELAQSVAEALPGAYGPMNIQCIIEDSGAVRIIDINARFGGGYPLAHSAGARFTDWLLDELEGRRPARFDAWTDDLAMLRYDEAIFVPGYQVRGCNPEFAPSLTSTTQFSSNGITSEVDLKR